MPLNLLNRQRTMEFHVQWVRDILKKAMGTTAGQEVEVTVVFLSDRRIRALNQKWRQIDAATDCLSFPMQDETPDPFMENYLGDIAISLQTARQQAGKWFPGFPEQRALVFEVTVLFVHSLLHLLGYDHIKKIDRQIMSAKEKAILTGLFPDAPIEGLTQR